MSAWAGRVARAVEIGTLYVTEAEREELARLPAPSDGFTGPGIEVHLNGLEVVVDDERARAQAAEAPVCLCVEGLHGDRLCPIHAADSPHRRLVAERRRLADEVARETLARLEPS